jgi:hypothetical protein
VKPLSTNQPSVNKRTAALFTLMLLCIGFTACSGSGRDKYPALSPAQQTAKDKLDSLQKLAAQTALTYKNMDVPSLLNKLAEQSAAKKEPFNSLAYRELKGRTDVPADSLVALVNQSKNGNALLPLLLLRKLHEKEYLAIPAEERAAVLTDALQNSKTFNTWGLPHLYLEDASKAMFEAGKSAEPALRRMLSDTRPAPVFGSKEYMEYKRYNYRLCDYALFFLERLQGNADVHIPVSPADRDAQIKQILK